MKRFLILLFFVVFLSSLANAANCIFHYQFGAMTGIPTNEITGNMIGVPSTTDTYAQQQAAMAAHSFSTDDLFTVIDNWYFDNILPPGIVDVCSPLDPAFSQVYFLYQCPTQPSSTPATYSCTGREGLNPYCSADDPDSEDNPPALMFFPCDFSKYCVKDTGECFPLTEGMDNEDLDGDGTDYTEDVDDLDPAVGGADAGELCDGIDNNGNGEIDEGWFKVSGACDYDDNDGDGVPGCCDCDDNNDVVFPNQSEVGICDFVDNDCDGVVDECINNNPQCNDGLDNDGDNLIDGDDPGCNTDGYYDMMGNSELEPATPACSDGLDNDGDGPFDYLYTGVSAVASESDDVDECNAYFQLAIVAKMLSGEKTFFGFDQENLSLISLNIASSMGIVCIYEFTDGDNLYIGDPDCTSESDNSEQGSFVAIPNFQLNPGFTLFGSSASEDTKQKHCVYSGVTPGCYFYDVDSDGYKNASFLCADCNDCDDNNELINVSAIDKGSVDSNCNGPNGEYVDSDEDGFYDAYEDQTCLEQGPLGSDMEVVFDLYGCWVAPDVTHDGHDMLPGWSVE